MAQAGTQLAVLPCPRTQCCGARAAGQACHRGGVWEWLVSARGELWASIIAGALLLLGFVLAQTVGREIGQVPYWISLAIGMFHGCRAAWEALRVRKFDIDVLMVVGAGLAAWLDAPAEGALLLFLFVLSGALEALAMQRTTRAVEALHRLMPTAALKWSPRGAGANGKAGDWISVTPESLAAGDLIRILPGESVPADCRLHEGESSIDQANLTGESMPRSVRPGDDLFAGTINIGNPISAAVLRPAAQSSLQRILDLVTKAQQQREPVQRFIDRISQPYAISVFLLSAAVGLVWWLGFGDSGKQAAYTAITLLIVASPCAVMISTPTATLAAITRGARGGVLFKGGQSIERLSRLRAVAFDKTGTLTIGRPRVHEIHPIGWSDQNKLLAVAAGLEQDSTHPIAAAVREAATQANIAPARVENPHFTAGRGVGGLIDGAPARLGTLIHTQELIPVCLRARVQQVLESVQSRGNIATVVAHGDQAGIIILSDTARPGAEQLVARLHELGVKPVAMLTGDNRATARSVAESLGIDRFFAELLPEDKVHLVEAIKGNQLPTDLREPAPAGSPDRLIASSLSRVFTGVIGDGVNDAPALAAADVSIAIGSIGSDAALESADIVLLSDDLSVVPWAVRLARRARRTIAINLVFALGAIAIMAIATLIGSRTGMQLPLWMGVLGHEGGTLLVVFNSLLILAASAAATATSVEMAAHRKATPTTTPQHAAFSMGMSISSCPKSDKTI